MRIPVRCRRQSFDDLAGIGAPNGRLRQHEIGLQRVAPRQLGKTVGVDEERAAGGADPRDVAAEIMGTEAVDDLAVPSDAGVDRQRLAGLCVLEQLFRMRTARSSHRLARHRSAAWQQTGRRTSSEPPADPDYAADERDVLRPDVVVRRVVWIVALDGERLVHRVHRQQRIEKRLDGRLC